MINEWEASPVTDGSQPIGTNRVRKQEAHYLEAFSREKSMNSKLDRVIGLVPGWSVCLRCEALISAPSTAKQTNPGRRVSLPS